MYLIAVAVVLVCAVLLTIRFSQVEEFIRLPGEHRFLSKGECSSLDIPTMSDSVAPVYLSLVVPAYNEVKRLPRMLRETLAYLLSRQKQPPTSGAGRSFTFEIVVVDDGSIDGTSEVALEFSYEFGFDKVRVLKLEKNRGKGGAVRLGVLSSRGERVLMVDADGATDITELRKCEVALDTIVNNGLGIVCGSRAHLESDSKVERSILRTLLMKSFHLLVRILCVDAIQDTQCGFKLFSRAAARSTFISLHLERWAFDVEILFLAQRLGIPVAEVAVRWTEIDGSKLSPLAAGVQMGRDLIRISGLYTAGLWVVSSKSLEIVRRAKAGLL